MGVQTPTEYQFLKSKNTVERLEQNAIREGMDGGGRGRCPDGCERRQSAPRGLVFVSRNWRLQLSKRSGVWTDLDAAEGLPVEDRLQEALLPPLAAGSTARVAGGARERSWMDRGAKTVAFDKGAPAGAADGLLQLSRLAERPLGSRGDQKLHQLLPDGLLEASEGDGALEMLMRMLKDRRLHWANLEAHLNRDGLLEAAVDDEELGLEWKRSHLQQGNSDVADSVKQTDECAGESLETAVSFEEVEDDDQEVEECPEPLLPHPHPCISPA